MPFLPERSTQKGPSVLGVRVTQGKHHSRLSTPSTKLISACSRASEGFCLPRVNLVACWRRLKWKEKRRPPISRSEPAVIPWPWTRFSAPLLMARMGTRSYIPLPRTCSRPLFWQMEVWLSHPTGKVRRLLSTSAWNKAGSRTCYGWQSSPTSPS